MYFSLLYEFSHVNVIPYLSLLIYYHQYLSTRTIDQNSSLNRNAVVNVIPFLLLPRTIFFRKRVVINNRMAFFSFAKEIPYYQILHFCSFDIFSVYNGPKLQTVFKKTLNAYSFLSYVPQIL